MQPGLGAGLINFGTPAEYTAQAEARDRINSEEYMSALRAKAGASMPSPVKYAPLSPGQSGVKRSGSGALFAGGNIQVAAKLAESIAAKEAEFHSILQAERALDRERFEAAVQARIAEIEQQRQGATNDQHEQEELMELVTEGGDESRAHGDTEPMASTVGGSNPDSI